ncbi:hypothetical protein [Streptomyces sp. NPDC001222]|uniref:hypothetical protein n=1 Tax=Streptomyces sp. NPDC001222 TaxID=3364548 RepID=UPI00368FD385
MPQRVSNTPICRDCDGFASAAVATGARHRDGSRVTIRVVCAACQGSGAVRPARVRVIA